MVVGVEYVIPVPVKSDGTIADFSFEVVTAGGAGAVVRMGVRSGNVNDRPGAASLLKDHGTVSTTTTGVKLASAASAYSGVQALTAGSTGYISLVAQVASCVARAINATNPQLALAAAPSGSSNSAVNTQSGVTGALPANFTSNGDDWAPRVGVKWQ
jgi:cytoskeletal protein RodZ